MIRGQASKAKSTIRLTAVVVASNFAGHTGWYAFESISHSTGLNPEVLVGIIGGPIGIPVAIILLMSVDKAERKCKATEERIKAP